MSENLKILKDKRHRSSSSLMANNYMEGPYMENKHNLRGIIPEGEDQFVVADSRCDDLKEQLDLVKSLKSQKIKLKKRSITKIYTAMKEVPFQAPRLQHKSNDDYDVMNPNHLISVRARPKKKMSTASPGRKGNFTDQIRHKSSTLSHNNPDTNTQQRMIANVQEYDPTYRQEYIEMLHNQQETSKHNIGRRDSAELHRRRRRHAKTVNNPEHGEPMDPERSTSAAQEVLQHMKDSRRKRSRKNPIRQQISAVGVPQHTHNQGDMCKPLWSQQTKVEERPVVELFNNTRARPQRAGRGDRRITTTAVVADTDIHRERVEYDPSAEALNSRSHSKKHLAEPSSKTSTCVYNLPNASISKTGSRMKRGRHNKGYELPTVASRMKQRGMRYDYGFNNVTSIPFIVTKSITPSHNVGVNIQQVLNGMKSQQPICNIPMTLAHQMGLKHSPRNKANQVRSMSTETGLETCSVNVIKIGRRLLRLPSYKYISYRRVLNLYREGDGIVPRYLRSQTRPIYCYQPTFSEAARGDIGSGMESFNKRMPSLQNVKQSLAEYVNLEREYQMLSQKKGKDAETERRLEELSKDIAARETRVRQVVMAYNDLGQPASALQASASTLEGLECVRSAYRIRTGSEA